MASIAASTVGARRPLQCADMHRNVLGLRDQSCARVANRKRKIAAGIEYLGIGGAKHGFAHFLHDRAQPVLDDGTGDGVDFGSHACPKVFRLGVADTAAGYIVALIDQFERLRDQLSPGRLVKALSITSPIGCHALPSNCTRRICLMGRKTPGPVLIAIPRSRNEPRKSLM